MKSKLKRLVLDLLATANIENRPLKDGEIKQHIPEQIRENPRIIKELNDVCRKLIKNKVMKETPKGYIRYMK